VNTAVYTKQPPADAPPSDMAGKAWQYTPAATWHMLKKCGRGRKNLGEIARFRLSLFCPLFCPCFALFCRPCLAVPGFPMCN
jgi:hypothetical protein